MALKTSLMLVCHEGLEWIWRENWEHLLLEGGLPLILVVGMRQSFALRIHLLPVVAALEGVVDGTLHSFLQLDVGLGSGQNFTRSSDVMLYQMFI